MRGESSAGVLRLAAFALLCFALAGLGLFASPARAAPTTTGFALNRYRPAEAGSDWFALESLDLRGEARAALSLVADIAYRPLVLYARDGTELVPLVDGQFFYHAEAALNLWSRLRLSLSVPLLVYSQGGRGQLDELGGVANVPVASSDGSGLGDMRAALDLRLLGSYGGPFSLALGARAYAATGSEQQFTSDGRARFEGRLMWAGQPGWFSYAAHVGTLFHGERDDFAGEAFGTDLTFAAALGVRLAEGRLHVGPELFGETVISDGGDGFLYRATTPLEAILGAKLQLGQSVRLGAAAGRGFTRGIGAARFRFLASLDWFPAPAAPSAGSGEPVPMNDLDGDGVSDEWDACPDAPGRAHPYDRRRSGCPDPGDTDGDGITDDVDACPSQRGLPSGDAATHGCAPPDRDKDGVVDTIDACPDTPGVQTVDPLRSGCPADSDGDGINDADDACPGAAGPRDRSPRRHGCPKARIEAGEIKIAEQVQFATASARILPESDALLRAVAEILLQHPEIELVSVEGHTDGDGSPRANEKLSRDRALSVVMRLVDNGVTARRLTARGFGAQVPLDDNATPEGRQNNRRVEFRILRVRANPIQKE
jgi:OOP family OmpA-OmpF porin